MPRLLKHLVPLFVFTLLLSACSGTSAKEEAKTKTVRDAYGEVTIPLKPQNMLVTNTSVAESMLELGIIPQKVLIVKEIEPEYRFKMFEKHKVEMIEVQQYEENLERILALAPDLIVGPQGSTDAKRYEALTKIAPTVAIDIGSSLAAALPAIGKMFGKEAEAEKSLAKFNEKIAEAKQKLQKAVGEQTVLVLRVEPKQYRALGAKDLGPGNDIMYHMLGLKIPEKLADAKDWFTPVSLETLPEIKADHIFVEKRVLQNYSSEQSMKDLENSPLWKSMEAVKAGRVYPLETKDYIQGEGPVGSALFIDYLVEKLVP
ncbi:ABC transporter substrate-binding protein [Paenibacillus contaminans]|nr:ABC transporter substrate-binding protein [Paenibacillus contaminans]